MTITALTRPTRTVSQPVKQASRWRLISHLSLNHMLISGDNGVQVLKETFALYNINDNPAIQQLIDLVISSMGKNAEREKVIDLREIPVHLCCLTQ